MMAKIFISYDRESKDVVEQLVQDLTDDGHEIWFDQHLTGGQKWWDNILSEIRQCEIFVAALTPAFLESKPCQRELKYANDLQRNLLPVRLSEIVLPDSLPPHLSELQWVDYSSRNIDALKSLQRTLRRLPKASPPPDPLPDAPPAPISLISRLREKIDSDSLTRQDQIQLVFDLRQQFRQGVPAKEIRELLHRLRKRDDLFATVSQDVDDLIRDIGASQPRVAAVDKAEPPAPSKGNESPKPPRDTAVILPGPPPASQHTAPPGQEPPQQPYGTGAASGEAKPHPPASSPQLARGLRIEAVLALAGIGLALAVILPGIYFYMGSGKKPEQPHLEPSFGSRPPSIELAPPNLNAAPPAPSNRAATELSPLNAAKPGAEPAPSDLAVAEPSPNAAKAGSEFTDCANCPAMIVVPAGKFIMGSPENQVGRNADEGPQREVRIAKPFAVSKYVVTFAEWDVCAVAKACPKVKDEWGRGQMPVINVSWDEAKKYVAWLSQKTGKTYRLLTEAEWEYAARAGTTTRYYWGDDVGKNNANCNGCGSQWDNKQTAPIGSFKPNAFGLYDMAGNVWEWVEDAWHENYIGAPTDGSAWRQGGNTSRRAARGGSWNDNPQILRVAFRSRGLTSGGRGYDFGFRVARTLTP
jgi:formylglycine-generating enzyme required for sulfatase activity